MKVPKFFSLKHTIMLLFLPLIVVFVILSGSSTYLLAVRQIEENAYRNITDLVVQTKSHMNEQLLVVFGELVAVVNGSDIGAMVTSLHSNEGLDSGRYLSVANQFERIYQTHYPMIDSIYMNFNDGKASYTKVNYLLSDVNFSYKDYSSRYPNATFDYRWENLHEDDIFRYVGGEKEKVVSVFSLFGSDTSQARGIVLFHLKEAFFSQILSLVEISENGYLALASADGLMMFKDVDDAYVPDDKVRSHLMQREAASGTFRFTKTGGERTVVIYDTLPINGWRLAAIFPENDILEKIGYIKYLTIGMMIIVIAVAAAMSHILLRTVTRPISALTSKVKQVESGKLDTIFDIRTNNEIGILNRGIGSLIQRVQLLLHDIRLEQEQKRKAELAVLNEQIKPHFLYNTLHSLGQLIAMERKSEALAMVDSLSTFYRLGLSNGKEMIDVQEEVELVQHYLYIVGQRYSDTMRYTVEVDPALNRYVVLKLLLQPLVENAIYHGAKQKRGLSDIAVTGTVQGECMIFRIADNGKGIPEERLRSIQASLRGRHEPEHGKGFGLYNVHARIQSYFGAAYGIEIESEYGEGTVVTVRLPKLRRQEVGDS
ncbi:sensor histidine kinase [Paenibacillus sp.]|uniref:sensor histidine kinase n=1 Tax=Paenibacillus sp. TaxID=58172 RepID=UPI002D6F86A9|nr:sensor histidine kinase [Paenibacillus sp.]HZG55276.1 sensor histidine kinase [Paenibacillus sp.]